MDDRLLIGWAVNAVWLIHLVFRHKSGPIGKVIALAILGIPYLGSVFCYILYVLEVPTPLPPSMRQDEMNHYGRSTHDVSDVERSSFDVPGVQRSARKRPWIRFGILLIGFMIIIPGIISTFGISGSYENWWGGLVFGPAAILAGVLFVYVMTKRPEDKKRDHNLEWRRKWFG